MAVLVLAVRGPTWAAGRKKNGRAAKPMTAGVPGSGIQGTEHDFTLLTNNDPTEPLGLCTFCHTPHKALKTLLLWNHTLSQNTFNWDVSTTTAGTTFPTIVGNAYKGPTAKCLSCHDGSVAVGDVAWFDEASRTGANALNPDTMNVIDPTGAHLVGGGGNMSGNHPVAMPYPYLNGSNTYNQSATGSSITLTEWQATPVAPVRLYNDDGAGNISQGPVAGKSGIECSSCHDPHNKKSPGDMFLLGSLNGTDTSYLCLKCHMK